MYVISYDIASDRLRNKIAKILEEYGIRIQYSVFECTIGERKYMELYSKLMELMTGIEEGNIRFYFICGKCENKIKTIGEIPMQIKQRTEKVIVI